MKELNSTPTDIQGLANKSGELVHTDLHSTLKWQKSGFIQDLKGCISTLLDKYTTKALV